MTTPTDNSPEPLSPEWLDAEEKRLDAEEEALVADAWWMEDVHAMFGAGVEGTPWWVVLQRGDGQMSWFGPYPSEESAQRSMDDSLLIEGECQTDCTDCFVQDGQPGSDAEVTVVDLDDPDHTGVRDE